MFSESLGEGEEGRERRGGEGEEGRERRGGRGGKGEEGRERRGGRGGEGGEGEEGRERRGGRGGKRERGDPERALEGLAHPTGASQDVRVVRILVAFTRNLDLPKLVLGIQLCLTLPLERSKMPL